MALERASVVKKADAFAREGKLDQAIAEYRALVEENPGDSSAANTLGDLYARLGDVDRAIDQYTRLGETEWQQGFSAKAAAFYKKALKVDPNCEGALARLGEIAASQSLVVDASRHWKRLLERRRSRGDAAGEAEVTGWLAELGGSRPASRQATSVGMTLRTEAVAAVAEPVSAVAVLAPPEEPRLEPVSSEVPAWQAPAEAAEETIFSESPVEAASWFGSAVDAVAADTSDVAEVPFVVEQFGQLAEQIVAPEPAAETPAIEGAAAEATSDEPFALTSLESEDWVAPSSTAADDEAAHLVELRPADVEAGAAAFVSEDDGAAAAQDDWEIVVDVGGELDMASFGDSPVLEGPVEPSLSACQSAAAMVADVQAPVDVVEPVVIETSRPGPVAATAVTAAEPGESDGVDEGFIAELVAAAETPNLRFQAGVQLGRIFLQRGDLGQGIEWLERACGGTAPVRDHGLQARYDLADALERSGAQARALEVLSDLEFDAGSYRDVDARISRLSRVVASAP